MLVAALAPAAAALLLRISLRFSLTLTAKAATWTQIWGVQFYLMLCSLLPTGMTIINVM